MIPQVYKMLCKHYIIIWVKYYKKTCLNTHLVCYNYICLQNSIIPSPWSMETICTENVSKLPMRQFSASAVIQGYLILEHLTIKYHFRNNYASLLELTNKFSDWNSLPQFHRLTDVDIWAQIFRLTDMTHFIFSHQFFTNRRSAIYYV